MKNITIFFLHLLVAACLGYIGLQIQNDRILPPIIGVFLMWIAISLAVYHIYIYHSFSKTKENKTSKKSRGVKILPGTEIIGGVAGFGGSVGGKNIISGPGTPGDLFS